MVIQRLTLIDLVVVINCKLIQTDMDEDLSKEVEPVQSTIPASIEIDVNSPIQEGSPSLSVDGNASIQDASPAMTGGINPHYQPNMLHLQPHNVNFVMGPNGQMIAIEKPPFVWKHFFIGGGIPFAIFFIPLLILMIGDVLDYDDYKYEDHQVTMTKDENSTIYRGQLTVEENYYLLESCEFYSPQDTMSDIYCNRYDDYKAHIRSLSSNTGNAVVGHWNNDNGTVYFDTGTDYGEEVEVQMEFRTDSDSNDFFMVIGDLVGFTCLLGLLLSIIFLIVGFSQGKPGMGWGGVAALASFPVVSILSVILVI